MTSSPLSLKIVLHVLQMLDELLKGEAGRSSARGELTSELIQTPLPLQLVVLHLFVADECARALLCVEYAADLELTVSPQYGVGIDRKIHCELPYGGQLVTRGERSGGDSGHDLIDDLPIHGDAAAKVQAELEELVSFGAGREHLQI
jgi:hypothetical protein